MTSQIHAKVLQILDGKLDDEEFYDCPSSPFMFQDFFHQNEGVCYSYNWVTMKNFLNEYDFTDKSPLNYDICSKISVVLQPIFGFTHQVYAKLLLRNPRLIYAELKWTGYEEIIMSFLKNNHADSAPVEGILLLTALLENCIGNVYFTATTQNPPHLLKDLLKEHVLIDIFGDYPMFFLRMLIGTPHGINLRNIVWHGFPNTHEVPQYFLSVLVYMTISFSQLLKRSELKLRNRPRLSNINKKLLQIVGSYEKSLDCFINNELQFQERLNTSKFIPKTHLSYWKNIYRYYKEEKYCKFIILILPQIEMILRNIYAIVNNYDATAKIDEYYITIDTLFEKFIPNTFHINEIFDEMSLDIMKVIYDLFISLNGPRLRDKIGHGEAEFKCIDKSICSILFAVSLDIMAMSIENHENCFWKNYESQFHINCVFWVNRNDAICALEKLEHLIIPNHMRRDKQLIKNHLKIRKLLNIHIFNRNPKENEFMNLLNRILKNIQKACLNLIQSFEIRLDINKKHELRSKQRRTLKKMLQSQPNFQFTIHKLINWSEILFKTLQNDQFVWTDNVNFMETMKNLKLFLKHSENLEKYCFTTSNEWERSNEICANINQILT